MAMTFGIHIGHMGGPLDEMRKLWVFADTAGFDWFSVSDHFQESPPRGGDIDCYEAIATLTAAAVETKRVRLGALVYCVVYRNPGLHAKSLTTIDHLSGGRVDCGLGAGWHEVEGKAFGYAWPRIGVREDMLEEYAQIMRMLFDREQKRASFAGQHYTVENAPNNPKPLQPRVPIWIGGRGEKRTLRAAARYADGWNAPYIGPDEWIHKSKVLTSGARPRAAIRSRSSAPPTSASTSVPTPRARLAARPSSSRTSATTRAVASCAARPSRSWTCSPATATPAASA